MTCWRFRVTVLEKFLSLPLMTMEVTQFTFLVFATLVVVINPQKVPPGVNPNTYQQQQQQQPQPPPPPQAQQYQPPPPPPQPAYQQQPIASAVPPEHPQKVAHIHHDHHGQPQLLNTANLAEEREHMQEHLNVNIDTSKMTEQELQFHYFKMHDADNNNKLDGCELIKSLIHWHEEHEPDNPFGSDDDEIMEVIDDILENDLDMDGYIDWTEFERLYRNSTGNNHSEEDLTVSKEKIEKNIEGKAEIDAGEKTVTGDEVKTEKDLEEKRENNLEEILEKVQEETQNVNNIQVEMA